MKGVKSTIARRFKITSTGKVLRRKMGTGHFRSKKSQSNKLDMKKRTSLHSSDRKALRQEGIRI